MNWAIQARLTVLEIRNFICLWEDAHTVTLYVNKNKCVFWTRGIAKCLPTRGWSHLTLYPLNFRYPKHIFLPIDIFWCSLTLGNTIAHSLQRWSADITWQCSIPRQNERNLKLYPIFVPSPIYNQLHQEAKNICFIHHSKCPKSPQIFVARRKMCRREASHHRATICPDMNPFLYVKALTDFSALVHTCTYLTPTCVWPRQRSRIFPHSLSPTSCIQPASSVLILLHVSYRGISHWIWDRRGGQGLRKQYRIRV